jgi:hypothetical protein
MNPVDSVQRKYQTATALLAALNTRLLAEAEERQIDVNRLRRQVAFERLLSRLAHVAGRSAATWVLKGGLALELRLMNECRSTKDIDLAVTDEAGTGADMRQRLIDVLAVDPFGDYFTFLVGPAKDLAVDEAGRPGWRFPVEAKLGKTFASIRLDVVARAAEIDGAVEKLTFPSALAFAGYPSAVTVAAIDVDQHAAEKFHALTKDYGDHLNTRVKDLVDLVLLIERGLLDPARLRARLDKVFVVRASHSLPEVLPEPPGSWRSDYANLVSDLEVDAATVDAAHALVSSFWRRWVTSG